LPHPEAHNNWYYNNDPLIYNDESTYHHHVWEPDDPLSPWKEPFLSTN
jgi:hypothetical protein